VAAILTLAAGPLAHFFGLPALADYLGIAVLGYLLGPFIHPQMALFSREMAFNRLAAINLLLALVAAGVSILLAFLGFSALSFAWAGVASALAGAILCLVVGRDLSIYRPSLSHWRSVVSFGAYSSATAVLGRISEALPVFIFGKLLSAEAVAIGQRTAVLSLFPERVVLAAVGPVALPEFSRRAREGKDLTAAYLAALSHVSVVQWPAMILLAVLAEPIVLLVLGGQWLDVVPLLRILSPALMLTVPIGLQYAILVAVGAVHRLPRLLALQMLVMAAALLISAPHGLHVPRHADRRRAVADGRAQRHRVSLARSVGRRCPKRVRGLDHGHRADRDRALRHLLPDVADLRRPGGGARCRGLGARPLRQRPSRLG
jgi:O-antigen/teichoic acid export membrane protein